MSGLDLEGASGQPSTWEDLLFPNINSTWGFILYSFVTYLIILFMGWLLNPTYEETMEKGTRAEHLIKKGYEMREKNKENLQKQLEK